MLLVPVKTPYSRCMFELRGDDATRAFGTRIGILLRGGEVIELIGDVGAGKTTFVKGLGVGLGIDDDVQSPSFTLSRIYDARDGLQLHHYDFYRLTEAGVVGQELAESVDEPTAITVVEWGQTVQDVLPDDHAVIRLNYTPDGDGRICQIVVPDDLTYLQEGLT